MKNQQAFTLIELLVVVLIIGILAGVALPQYQKAVEKSKGAQALTLLKSVYQAAKAYQLANGSWPSSIDELAVDIPWTGHEKWYETGAYKAPLSNGEWSLQLFSSPDSHGNGVSIGRISGPYQGTAFEIYADRPGDFPTESIFCAEGYSRSFVQHKFTKNKGAYCQQIFRGTEIPNFTGGMDYFLFTN